MSPKHACPPLKSAFVYVLLPLRKRSEAKTSAQVQLQSHDQQGHSAGLLYVNLCQLELESPERREPPLKECLPKTL